ncbi:MAG: hypothetical protein M3N43_02155 [Actinomycetota bacterium]|nr:hypothetical protein [Actinomycetota bacterium]
MTDPNKYNPRPDIAVVLCGACGGRAEFRSAFTLTDKRHWSYWPPRLWPTSRVTDWQGSQEWTPTQGLPPWQGWLIIEHDPALYRWKHPSGGYRKSDEGILACSNCVSRRRHLLDWPSDAYYRFELRQGLLWAWNRDQVDALLEFIISSNRNARAHGGHFLFLHHIPGEFLQAQARSEIVHRLRRRLTELDAE